MMCLQEYNYVKQWKIDYFILEKKYLFLQKLFEIISSSHANRK